MTGATRIRAPRLSWLTSFALSLVLAAASFASRWLLQTPRLPWELFFYVSITLLVPWLIILRSSIRAYGRRGYWLLIGAPLALFWPVALLLVWLVCLVPGSDCM